jgi:hypothetical protein
MSSNKQKTHSLSLSARIENISQIMLLLLPDIKHDLTLALLYAIAAPMQN